MKTISHSIEINAPAAEVWKVLTDLAAYSDWNPFIREASGDVTVGQRLTLRMFPADGKPMTFRPRVLAADPGVELRWIGHFVLPGIFDGEHRFTLTTTATGGTELLQAEKFSGLLVPFTAKTISATRQNFAALNQALKTRAESLSQPNPAPAPTATDQPR
ncbi:SRPBCC domain-containing protein [Streptomyces canus]|uniref:SRPBCC domain-containing protein n=1 Tax=Streptomyces canus TaxID=58343 RepID=UPI002E26DA8C